MAQVIKLEQGNAVQKVKLFNHEGLGDYNVDDLVKSYASSVQDKIAELDLKGKDRQKILDYTNRIISGIKDGTIKGRDASGNFITSDTSLSSTGINERKFLGIGGYKKDDDFYKNVAYDVVNNIFKTASPYTAPKDPVTPKAEKKEYKLRFDKALGDYYYNGKPIDLNTWDYGNAKTNIASRLQALREEVSAGDYTNKDDVLSRIDDTLAGLNADDATLKSNVSLGNRVGLNLQPFLFRTSEEVAANQTAQPAMQPATEQPTAEQTAAQPVVQLVEQPATTKPATNKPEQPTSIARPVEDWEYEDYARLVSAGADVASMLTAFVPGYGTIASAGLGLGSTIGNFTADLSDKNVSLGSAAVNALTGLGMDAVGLVPGWGAAGKGSKIAKNIIKLAPRLATVWAASTSFNPAMQALNKLTDGGPKTLTVDDWRALSAGITATAGMARWGAGELKNKRMVNKHSTTDHYVTTKSGKEVKVDKTTLERLKNAPKAEQNKILQTIAEGEELPTSFKKWYNLTRVTQGTPDVRKQRTLNTNLSRTTPDGRVLKPKPLSDDGLWKTAADSDLGHSWRMPEWAKNWGYGEPTRTRKKTTADPEPVRNPEPTRTSDPTSEQTRTPEPARTEEVLTPDRIILPETRLPARLKPRRSKKPIALPERTSRNVSAEELTETLAKGLGIQLPKGIQKPNQSKITDEQFRAILRKELDSPVFNLPKRTKKVSASKAKKAGEVRKNKKNPEKKAKGGNIPKFANPAGRIKAKDMSKWNRDNALKSYDWGADIDNYLKTSDLDGYIAAFNGGEDIYDQMVGDTDYFAGKNVKYDVRDPLAGHRQRTFRNTNTGYDNLIRTGILGHGVTEGTSGYDNLLGDRTYNRTLGRISSDYANLFNNQLRTRGLELFDKGNGYYRLRKLQENAPSASVELPEVTVTAPKIATPGTAPENTALGRSGGLDPRKGGPQLNTADLLGTGRMLGTIVTNNAIARGIKNSLSPLLLDPLQIRRNVTGDLVTRNYMERMGAEANRIGSRPITSDGSLMLGQQLDYNNQANDYRAKGYLADKQAIDRTTAEARQASEQNAAARVDVANRNRASMLGINQAKANIEAQRRSANWAQAFAPWLMDKEMKLEQNAKINRELDYEDSAYAEGVTMEGKDKIAREQFNVAKANYAKAGGTDWENSDEYKQALKNYENAANAYNKTYRDNMSKYRRNRYQYRPFISFASGGKMSVGDRLILQRAKDFNKSLLEDSKMFHKIIMDSKKENNKLIMSLSGLTKDLIIKSMTL